MDGRTCHTLPTGRRRAGLAVLAAVLLAGGCSSDDRQPGQDADASATATAAPVPGTASPATPPGAAPTTTPTSAAVVPPAATCVDGPVVLALRGSNEAPGLAGPAGVVGREVAAALPAAPDGTPARLVEVDYPATLQQYERSVGTGAEALGATLVTRRGCARGTTVLVGYSQGAMVVGEALRRAPDEVRDAVGAVVLLGDPARDADDPAALQLRDGAAPGTDGVLGPRGVPVSLDGRVLTWCAPGDPVCDASACEGGQFSCLLDGPGLAAHRTYATADATAVVGFVLDAVG